MLRKGISCSALEIKVSRWKSVVYSIILITEFNVEEWSDEGLNSGTDFLALKFKHNEIVIYIGNSISPRILWHTNLV